MSNSCLSTMFSAIPGKADPLLLRPHYQTKLIKSFQTYLLALGRTVNIDLSAQVKKLETVNTESQFSPSFYALYTRFRNLYKARKIDELIDCVQLFNEEDRDALYVNEIKLSFAASERWEIPVLKEIRGNLPLDGDPSPTPRQLRVFSPVQWDDITYLSNFFYQSLNLLETLDPFLLLEVKAYISKVKLFISDALHSITSPRYFGAVYMRVPGEEENKELVFMETLTHEVSHLHLFIIMDFDPLILNSEHDLYESPLRKGKRPMLGVFHSVFVLARIVRVLRKYHEQFPLNQEAKNLLEKRVQQFVHGVEILSKEARLTVKGGEIFNSLELCAYEQC